MSQISRLSEARFDNPPTEPWDWLQDWLHQAAQAGQIEPTAMNLATADASGRISNRVVLFKGLDNNRCCFYSNYTSRKAGQLEQQSAAALCFWWDRLDRQIRLEGKVQKLPAAQSDGYFASRPRGSQIGAWASEQSRPIANRKDLQQRFADTEARFADQPVPRPPHWGGYALRPDFIEFWQGQRNRFHDRMTYRLDDETWRIERLQP